MGSTETWRQARARLADLIERQAPASEVEQARAELRALFSDARITALVSAAPEIAGQQRERLAVLLGSPPQCP